MPPKIPLEKPGEIRIPPTFWESKDPLVAEIANAIEKKYPGSVLRVGYEEGGLEIDIETKTAIIEIKEGGAGLTKQVEARQKGPANPTGKPVIAYSPKLGKFAKRDIAAKGGIGVSDLEVLLGLLGP